MKRSHQNKDSLTTYRGKRNFRRTPEPKPDPVGTKRSHERARSRFVIQKHDATSLHYDFRLEAGGVLKSWAVPKGPSIDPREKRLAIPTEDHPLEYARFEGVIPEGEYGAGPVIVWDAGTYRNLTERNGKEVPVERAIRNGHLSIWLAGKKLTGGYALTRVGGGKRARWLLVKEKDERADARRNPAKTQPRSVRTDRTIEEVAARARPTKSRRRMA